MGQIKINETVSLSMNLLWPVGGREQAPRGLGSLMDTAGGMGKRREGRKWCLLYFERGQACCPSVSPCCRPARVSVSGSYLVVPLSQNTVL